MRTTKHLPGKIVLILAFQIIVVASLFAQNESETAKNTFDPLPETLLSSRGTLIKTTEQWEKIRRSEVLELFRDHVYGSVPDTPLSIDYEVKFFDANALGGTAVQKEVEVRVSNSVGTLAFSMLIYLPKDPPGPVPLFLGLNFYGNHTIHPDKQITITDSWARNNKNYGIKDHTAREAPRGAAAYRWPVEMILSRGYGLATIYSGDIDPDFDDGFKNGVHELFPEGGADRDPGSWGTISAWAWGLSRAMDYFETDPDIDKERIAVMGHSRMGKTALWAGAQDERFALVISNNSGCGGAALSRRTVGERVSVINEAFPHWFNDRFNEYSDNETALPVDQHMLMALMAPRPLYVASAVEDEWADPHGEYLSLYYGSRVYELYGKGKLEEDQLPEINQPRWIGNLGYHIRTGKHGVSWFDWKQYMDFADKNMRSSSGNEFENPVSMEWISEHLKATTPRLILTPEKEATIREKIEAGDKVTDMGFQLLRNSANSIMEFEPLSYKKSGKRLLGVSREAVRRLTTLALVYRFDKDEHHLNKLEEELRAVSSFKDWNPSHFLDVGEMAAGIALALDWAGEWISPEVEQLARKALIEKALKPGVAASENNWWTNVNHNWNLVCNGGLSLAALAVFEDEPELASRVLHQAAGTMPLALKPYGPGGIYPEGASYWFYATTYLTVAVSAYETALGTDFSFTDAPGVMESAIFSQVLAGPSGEFYNYFDASLGGYQSLVHFGLLSWFAARSGEGLDWIAYEGLLNKELNNPRNISGTRLFSTHFLSTVCADRDMEEVYAFPDVWSGGGEEPIVIFRDRENDKDAFFLAAKGGRAADNHGNMDAGSFIFEIDGVRWSVDPGNQSYGELEQIIGEKLWDTSQVSQRWSLLTKNNFGHSTLSVNGEMHLADARSQLIREERRTANPEATFDLTPLFGKNLEMAQRSFIRVSDHSLRIRDQFVFSPKTQNLTWQLITQAEVKIKNKKATLYQDGKELYLQVISEEPYEVNVVNLSPPPLSYDKNIEDLKRIEIRVDRKAFQGNSGQLIVDLTTQRKN